MYLREPEEILVHFIRSRVSEITRVGLSNRQVADTQNFSGNDILTEFTLTNKPVAINTVTVGGTEVYPYQDFNIDLDNKKIKFRTAPVTGTNNIVVNYYKTSTWVFPDTPRDDLSKTSFPRVGVLLISEPQVFESLGSTDTELTATFQIDIMTHKDLKCIIDSETKTGQDVVTVIARNIGEAIKTHWANYLIYKVRDVTIGTSAPAPFEPGLNIFRRLMEVSMLFEGIEEKIT